MAITNGTTNGATTIGGGLKANVPTAAQLNAVKAVVRPNLIKQTMLENRLAFSFGMRVAFSVEMPLVARRAGYTSLLMNMEHMAIDMQTMSNVCVSCLNVGITPTVVVPTVAAEWVARCLDSGAQAVIIPHVNNVAEARICVNAGKYPPLGHRSITMVTPQTQYETGLNYAALAPIVNDEILIMPMIETQEGLDNIEEIAQVEGVDCIVIGCSDLCFELGIPGQQDHPTFHAAIDKICKAADAASVNGRKVFVGLGGLEPRPDLLVHFTKKYACIRYAMAGRDFAMLISAMNKQVGEMEEISRGLSM